MIPILRERVPALSTSVAITTSQAAQMANQGIEPTLSSFQTFCNYILNFIRKLFGDEPVANQDQLHQIYRALNPEQVSEGAGTGADRVDGDFLSFLASAQRLMDITEENAQQEYYFSVKEHDGHPRKYQLLLCHGNESMGGLLITHLQKAFLTEYCCDPNNTMNNRHYPQSPARLVDAPTWGYYCQLFTCVEEMETYGEGLNHPPSADVSRQHQALNHFECYRDAISSGWLTDITLSPGETTLKGLFEQFERYHCSYQQYITACQQINSGTFEGMLESVTKALGDPAIPASALVQLGREFKQFQHHTHLMATFDVNHTPYYLELAADIEFACRCKELYEKLNLKELEEAEKTESFQQFIQYIGQITHPKMKQALKESHLVLSRLAESETVALSDYFDPVAEFGHLLSEDGESLTYLMVGLNKTEVGYCCLPGNFAATLKELDRRGKEDTLAKPYRKELKKALEKITAQMMTFYSSSLAHLEKLVAEVGMTSKGNPVDPPLCQWLKELGVGVSTWPEGKERKKAEKILEKANKMINKHNHQAVMQQALAE